ncbi:methylated-DNA--[protein]-cysteine S-methyltransferase [Luteolibacter sp. AS25]|uniref:methylated-DNA--[protein]-cysteine S-methyltransferase n=1 Tax=Luteolibacter sp. AS25 TaxID=3135776 RepID=UPI00398A5B9D
MDFQLLSTPIGKLRLRATGEALIAVDHVNQQTAPLADWVEATANPILQQAIAELNEYFAGERTEFEIPLSPLGTPFQLSVWNALRTVPYGKTATYTDIAEIIGNKKAVRAIGAANGRNPLSIFIPCHRVIGKSGKLVGYAGGLHIKTILLDLEQNSQGSGIFSESLHLTRS